MGPLVAAAFLYFRPEDYRTLFALTIVPGIIVVLILLRVPDTRREAGARSIVPTRDPTPNLLSRRCSELAAEARCRAPSGARWR